jgi:hypothetical protein
MANGVFSIALTRQFKICLYFALPHPNGAPEKWSERKLL